MTTTTPNRITIVGGGLIGLLSAYYLRKAGLEVEILERDLIGSGASRGNGGQMVVIDSTPLSTPGMAVHGARMLFSSSSAFFVPPSNVLRAAPFLLRFAAQATRRRFATSVQQMDFLNRQTHTLVEALKMDGIGRQLMDSPFLYTYSSLSEARSAQEHAQQLSARRLGPPPSEVMGREELTALEPALGSAVKWGFSQAGELWGDPSVFVDELEEWLRHNHVTIHEQTRVTGVRRQGTEYLIEAEDRTYSAEAVVLAAGAWSRELLPQLGIRSFITPAKGYSFSVTVETMPKGVIMFGDAHVGATPIGHGRVRLAGTLEFDNTYDSYDGRRIDSIIKAARPYLKDADWSTVADQWVAPRPMTPDGLPLIGEVSKYPGIYVASGHNMIGFSLGPSTAHTLTKLITGQIAPADIAAFNPARFN